MNKKIQNTNKKIKTVYINNYNSNLSKNNIKIKRYKPINNSNRVRIKVIQKELDKKNVYRKLTIFKKKALGRNNRGRIVCRKSKPLKRRYRIIDFKRNDYDQKFIVERIEHDPNRSANLALIRNVINGKRKFILQPDGLIKGMIVESSEKKILSNLGNCMRLKFLQIGTVVHNISINYKSFFSLARSAGTYCIVKEQLDRFTVLYLPSKEIKKISNDCFATIGRVGNIRFNQNRLGKAGRKIKKAGFRMKVRGTAKNAVDHPFGGGEGKAPQSKGAVSRKGIIRGKKTRRNKSTTNVFILKRRKKNK